MPMHRGRFVPSTSRIAVIACGLLALGVRPAHAQSASASVTANVQQPLSVSKSADLAFGNVFPGLNKTIAVTDAGAASFSVSGQSGANVNVSFSLPSTLASGGNSLPIANWTARRNSTSSSASGTDFTPSASATSAVIGSGGELHVFVGATAQPASGQPAGTYSGTLTITVVYF